MNNPFSEADATQLIFAARRHRESYDAKRHAVGDLVVSGAPQAWESTANALEADGAQVVAFHDIKGLVNEMQIGGRPVIRGDVASARPLVPVVFAGRPRKSWFSSSPPGPQACFFHVAPQQWQITGRHTPNLWNEHRKELMALFRMLADDRSRCTLAAIIRARIEGDSGYQRISDYNEYEHPIVRAEAGDIVIDAGAFEGDTTAGFSRAVGRHGRVIAMEPDPRNYTKLAQETARTWKNVTPLCIGAWSDDRTLTFAGGDGGSSKITESGSQTIAVGAIDVIVQHLRLPKVDLLKLDVEGAEAHAIAGAAFTIRHHRPKLLVSIYHEFEDLYKLPALLERMTPDYRYYLGHHSFYQMETDLYAIPNERWSKARVRGAVRSASRRAVSRVRAMFPASLRTAGSGCSGQLAQIGSEFGL